MANQNNAQQNPQQTRRPPMTKADREEKLRRKIEIAKEPGSIVLRAPNGPEMQAVVQVFTQLINLYPKAKLETGPFGTITEAKGQRFAAMIQQIILNGAHLSEQMVKALPGNNRFNVPRAVRKPYSKYKAEMNQKTEKKDSQQQKPKQQTQSEKEQKNSNVSTQAPLVKASKKTVAKKLPKTTNKAEIQKPQSEEEQKNHEGNTQTSLHSVEKKSTNLILKEVAIEAV